ncbi:hypothetical protein Back2_00570 [Nocardioides baekrokdamisoli]|uniref:Uncharacterized protein n=1 Tax=Nocardioides baekrokdamisoli TaxID=1804624 RepID=A0A3G9IAL2_9ACTN|nr:hypothetical protein Back2_00570 [Nocardioides baekrokdamisoli]
MKSGGNWEGLPNWAVTLHGIGLWFYFGGSIYALMVLTWVTVPIVGLCVEVLWLVFGILLTAAGFRRIPTARFVASVFGYAGISIALCYLVGHGSQGFLLVSFSFGVGAALDLVVLSRSRWFSTTE